jgi:asparagine synthetase B (glutamine-hydrolysing)
MCSIFLTNKRDIDLDKVNQFIRLRGPDHTETVEREGLIFVHNLLSINGAFTVQPFQDERFTALFNGEIYNHGQFGNFPSDGHALIPAYLTHGHLFPRQLDGEFAIILVDHASGTVIFSTDIFATKPLYFAFQPPYFAIGSYRSTLIAAGFDQVQRIPANQIYCLKLNPFSLNLAGSVHEFSLQQYRQDFDGWTEAFELAVAKRVNRCREKVFIGLSSGYDSGAISLALNRLHHPYHAYTVLGKERDEIIKARQQRIEPPSQFRSITADTTTRQQARDYIDRHVEPLNYATYSAKGDYNEFNLKLHDDSGATGLSMVCAQAIADGCKVYLSGQGADEIISDYGFAGKRIYPHSNFGGLFPEDLRTIFPWPSFFGSSQQSYLMKEEHVAGAYGIEARYPFLDRRVVQEFLSLHHTLKNRYYKSALRNYLEINHYPTAFDTKIGF